MSCTITTICNITEDSPGVLCPVALTGTPYEKDLDQTHYYFVYFYITNKLHFYFLISFWYPYFLLLPTNPLACNWELLLPISTCFLQLNSLLPLSLWPMVIWYFSCTSFLCSKSRKENINNDLAVLPSHDK